MKNLNRRKFIKNTALGELAFTGSLKAMDNLEQFFQKDNKKPEKPNLLFLWTDEQSYNTMAAYGNDKIKALFAKIQEWQRKTGDRVRLAVGGTSQKDLRHAGN